MATTATPIKRRMVTDRVGSTRPGASTVLDDDQQFVLLELAPIAAPLIRDLIRHLQTNQVARAAFIELTKSGKDPMLVDRGYHVNRIVNRLDVAGDLSIVLDPTQAEQLSNDLADSCLHQDQCRCGGLMAAGARRCDACEEARA